MTAVEWLINELKCIKSECGNQIVKIEIKEKLLEQAKEMFEEQVTLSHINGQSEFDKGAYGEHNKKLANEYYKQTFKSE